MTWRATHAADFLFAIICGVILLGLSLRLAAASLTSPLRLESSRTVHEPSPGESGVVEFTADVDEPEADPSALDARLARILTCLRSSSTADRWLNAIFECERLVLDPRTRRATLIRLNEIAHGMIEPESLRCL